jgi:hypothetical protein
VSIFSAASILYILVVIVVFVASYLFSGMTLMYIGRKAGLDSDWMPFVPFANTIYELRIVRMPWYFMFFLGVWMWSLVSAILVALLSLIHINLAIIVFILYSLCCIAFYVYYKYLFYKAFGINPNLIIAIIALSSGMIDFMLNVLIAYTGLFSYGSPQPVYRPGGEFSPHLSSPPHQEPQQAYAPPPPPVVPVSSYGSITCLTGMYSGNTFNMVRDEELTIGRDATGCNIVLERNADKVSRKHCGILYNPANRNYYVTDYSSNGTLTGDGSRLVRNIPTMLPPGTVV